MKIDLHVHSKEVSACGHLSVSEIIELYTKAGYDAIVLTNHFSTYSEDFLIQQGITDYWKGYNDCIRSAAELGKKAGLLVLRGFEIRFRENANDYLVYGMPDSIGKDYNRLFSMTYREFGQLAKENGFLFYQAHPFRTGMTVSDPNALFGIEVKNVHPRHNSNNDIAEAWAKKYSLHRIGGSDCHQFQDAGRSGIITDEKVENVDDLVRVLRNDLYTII